MLTIFIGKQRKKKKGKLQKRIFARVFAVYLRSSWATKIFWLNFSDFLEMKVCVSCLCAAKEIMSKRALEAIRQQSIKCLSHYQHNQTCKIKSGKICGRALFSTFWDKLYLKKRDNKKKRKFKSVVFREKRGDDIWQSWGWMFVVISRRSFKRENLYSITITTRARLYSRAAYCFVWI